MPTTQLFSKKPEPTATKNTAPQQSQFSLPKPKSSGGGGSGSGPSFEPLEWNHFFDRREMINGEVPLYIAGNKGHVFICMHGAGHSSQSFAALAKYLKNDYIVAAFDFRGHGDNSMENELDLSEATLVGDAIAAIRYINTALFSEASVIIVGHSMGGSIATKATAKIAQDHPTE